jgi:hypothetical protein
VRLGDGAGNFTGSTTISVGSDPRCVFVADVNLDGRPDLLTANQGSDNVSVRLGDGAGNFTGSTTISVGTGPRSVFIADVNLDGRPDLLAANGGSDNVSVRLGDGAGGFTGSTTISVGTGPFNVFAADVNLDGKPDLLTANQGSDNVSVRLGDGAGNFTGVTNISVGSDPRCVFVVDVNNDGRLDLLTANQGSNTVSVRLGDGVGGFAGTTNISVGNQPCDIFVVDVNSDGKPDILAANFGSNTVSVVLNNAPITDYTGGASGISAITYNNITFTASGNLSGAVTANGTLTLNAGVTVDLNGNTLTVANSASGAVAGTGFLTGAGSLVRAFSGNNAYAFPYTQSSNNRSATVSFTSGAGTGNLTYQFFNTAPGNTGLPQTYVGQSINAVAPFFWRIDATGTIGTYTLSLSAQNAPGVTNVSTLRIAKRPNSGSWSSTGAGTGNANTGTLANPTVVQSGMSGFSEFTLGGAGGVDNPLPVELTSFTGNASASSVRLAWSTASERNNAGFVILRSSSSRTESATPLVEIANYQFDASLKGKGTTTSATNYSFTDGGVETGKSYTYKLRSYDLDGTVNDYAQTVSVEVREAVAAKVFNYDLAQNYPNPFNPTTVIPFTMKAAGAATITVTDMLGRTVAVQTVQATAGENSYRFDGANLGSGMYFYTLRAAGFTRTMKMMLVK